MSKGRTAEIDVLNALLKGIDFSYRTQPNRYIALHTGSLSDTSNAATNEASYPNYSRVAVSTSDFSVNSNGEATNTTQIVFPSAGVGANQTITHFSITTSASGNSPILYYGALQTPVTVTSGVQVMFPEGSILIKEN